MKIKTLFASTMVAALVLAGCSSKPKEETKKDDSKIVTEITKPVEITFWHGMQGTQGKTLTELTDTFMKENKDIKVTLQNQSSYPELQQKLTATMPSPKNLPTITQAYQGWLAGPIKDGQVVDLKPYIENKTLKFDNYNDILPSLRSEVDQNGKIYGMPFNKSTEVIWYNKTMFKELGLKAPTNYDELTQVAKTIHDKKGIPGAGFDSLQTFYTTYLKTKGIDFNSKLDPTQPESIAAAQYYLDGIKGGYFRTAGTDHYLSGPFANEKVGMYIGSMAGEGFIKQGVGKKFEIGVARYPSSTSIQQGTNIYMFANATPEQRTAAYKYMQFLTTKENQIKWGVQTGYMPIRSSAIDSKEYKDSGSLLAPILQDATKNMYALDSSNGVDRAFNEAGKVFEGILADKNTDVKKAMETYKQTLKGIYQQ